MPNANTLGYALNQQMTKYLKKTVTAEKLPKIKKVWEEVRPFLVLMKKTFSPDYCI